MELRTRYFRATTYHDTERSINPQVKGLDLGNFASQGRKVRTEESRRVQDFLLFENAALPRSHEKSCLVRGCDDTHYNSIFYKHGDI